MYVPIKASCVFLILKAGFAFIEWMQVDKNEYETGSLFLNRLTRFLENLELLERLLILISLPNFMRRISDKFY
jgi:hypothetical protein